MTEQRVRELLNSGLGPAAAASIAASEALDAGGGPRLIDLGVINVLDLLDGPIDLPIPLNSVFTLFAGPDGFVVLDEDSWGGINVATDAEIADGSGGAFYQYAGNPFAVCLAALVLEPAYGKPRVLTETLRVGVPSPGYTDWFESDTPWQADHAYPENGWLTAEGHGWNTNDAGTSGSTPPDFAQAIIDTATAIDNDITWHDAGPPPTAGSLHLYAFVTALP